MPVCHCEQCRQAAALRHARHTGTSSTSAPSTLWKLYDSHREGEEAGEFLFRQPGRRHSLHGEPGGTRRDLRMVPVRQPGPRRRRYSHLGLRAAGPRVQCGAGRQDGDQCDRGLVYGHAALAQRLQVARPKSSMWFDETLACGYGAVSPHHRRRKRPGRGPPMAGAGAPVFQLDGEARRALREQALHREYRSGDGPADAPVL